MVKSCQMSKVVRSGQISFSGSPRVGVRRNTRGCLAATRTASCGAAAFSPAWRHSAGKPGASIKVCTCTGVPRSYENAHPLTGPRHGPTVQGYLGYKTTSARRSVGRCFLILERPRAKPVGLLLLKLGRRTKVVGLRFLRFKRMHESGRSDFLKMGPVRVNVLH